MPTHITNSILDRMLDPVCDSMTNEVAEKLVALRMDSGLQNQVDDFAERHHEGQLTELELEEYRSIVDAAALISVLQAKARKTLSRSLVA